MLTEVRGEIQALRAVAVAAVVGYHVAPQAVPGGFVGVDVFFAISGYLITAQLLRDVETHGRVRLRRFWARRVRRLLPAALLVLACCAVATVLLVAQLRWQETLTQIGASTLYAQNWQLAADAVDYLHASSAPSPVEHFWSLSIEEQLYLLWPLAIVLAVVVTRGRTARARRVAITSTLAALTGLSFAYSVIHTAANPAAAYFATPTRAWEFGAGGLLALLLPQALAGHSRARAGLSWAGLAGIALAAASTSDTTPFPGWRALLPVLATLAVIAAGLPRTRLSPAPLLKLAPVRLVGDVSYGIYLWHWPLIVFAPLAFPRADPVRLGVWVVGLAILAAWLSKRHVEDPLRGGSLRPRVALAGTAAAAAALLAMLFVGTSALQAKVDAAQRELDRVLATKPACFGAAARDAGHPCRNPALRLTVVPAPILAARGANAPCARLRRQGALRTCEFGVPARRARATVALVGDSHAGHIRAALEVVARARGWHGVSLTQTGCPFSAAPARVVGPALASCGRWRRAIPGWFRAHPEIGLVFAVAKTSGLANERFGARFEASVDGQRRAWDALPASVTRIVAIRDTPRTPSATLPCVMRASAARRPAGRACAVPRTWALSPDPSAVAASRSSADRAEEVDLSSSICDLSWCYPVVGGALVFKDLNHLTRVFATTLGARLGQAIDALPATGELRASADRRHRAQHGRRFVRARLNTNSTSLLS